MKFDWKAALPVVDFHPRMLFSTEEFLFFYGWPTLALVWSHLFSKLAGSTYKNYSSHAGQVKRKVNCGELSLEITLLGLPHIVKAASETWLNPRVNSTLAPSFQEKFCREMDVMPNVNMALSDSNNKDQLRDLNNYLTLSSRRPLSYGFYMITASVLKGLNQKVITVINTYDSSTLGKNLITSNQVLSAQSSVLSAHSSWSC